MKTDKNFLIFLLSILFFAGCSDDNDPPEREQEGFITIDPCKINNQLFEDGEFISGDEIGLYVVPYTNDQPGTIENNSYAANAKLIYNGISWLTDTGSKIPWPPGPENVDIYGYFPYDEALSQGNPTAYLFTVYEDQRSEENFENSDFLWSVQDQIAPTLAPVGLVFSHRLSKINININSTVDEIIELLPNATIGIINVQSSTLINLQDGRTTEDAQATPTTIYPKTTDTPMIGYQRSLEGIIAPQTIASGTQFISILVNDLYYYFRLTSELEIPQGTTINFNITITQTGLSVVTEMIEDWIPGGDLSGEVGTPAPKIVDLSEIDWTTTRVYQVLDNGTPIAEVAREYLYWSGRVDNQAIVVYPYSVDGTPDLSNGLVAQLMNRTINASLDEYEPLTTPVHGGQISFNPETNLITTYTAGTQELITKVEIVSSSSVIPASSTSVSFLTLRPEVITDIDGNTYPVVKIATQYWLTKNLTVEHYRDGSDLLYYYYNDDISNKPIWGAYYDWTTMNDPRGICPEGWHVPSRPEVSAMITDYLGSLTGAGRKLKANQLWNNLNYNDNVTGWSMLPAGRRTNTGTYTELYYYGQFWQTGQPDANNGYRLYLDYGNNDVHASTLPKGYTQSIRCMRD